jgi:hypothetical protein
MVGQASSLSVTDDGQPRVLRGASHRQSRLRSCMRLLRSARNDKLSPALTEGLPCFLPTFVLQHEINKCVL